ncbi:lysophospholipid acyltransferase family protein [Thiomicrospira cyclica]|uniref:Phospholipid/glycerol acyltransferase n=1 Tax=Thiomicrospira cyclica (strain DSM 14477 / JCM 11371 / ALM1) TaxID=717773 RepID=F6D8V1_THICA|nr:lysophospholipid acyltransferase family protein [Thiomicrospira cyclica]AEG31951.1 phospholipid/glycerol acyltransferase [Thiomicrospira cyclica ALM1]
MKIVVFFRSLLFEIGRISLTLFFAVFGQLLWLAPYPVRYVVLGYWARLTLAWLRMTCGVKVSVAGLEHLDSSQPSIVMAHHESAWETLALHGLLPRHTYVLKRELMWIPFFGWTLAMLKPIAINRSAGAKALKQLLQQAKQHMNERGDWVVIFPEGTRVPTGTVGKLGSGAARLAQQMQVPVYFLTHNAGEIWPKKSFLKYPGEIQVAISPRVIPADHSLEQINQQAADFFTTGLSRFM